MALYKIGQRVKSEDGHIGRVGIWWDDDDFVTFENDAAHPNPVKIEDEKCCEGFEALFGKGMHRPGCNGGEK